MSFFARIKNKLQYEFLKLVRPEMIGYSNSKLGDLKKTRISNMTHISNPANVTMGDYVFIGHFSYIDGYEKVHIGEGCGIASYVAIMTHSAHNAIRMYGRNYHEHCIANDIKGLKSGPISIGAYTFIGPHTLIMPGTVIGKGSMVYAYSFVHGTFPDYSIIKGQPGEIVGDTRHIDEKLLEEFPELKEFYYRKNTL